MMTLTDDQRLLQDTVRPFMADQGAINSAKVTLDRTVISAPIDGRTGIRLVDAGNILHATDATGTAGGFGPQ